jgi:NAD(P)-dependent dehydrogenase (short-subunit alcohol dehydrogenase family)
MTIANYSRRCSGKVAFVAGTGSGMGRATALTFAFDGAKLAATGVSLERLALMPRLP